MPTFGASFPAIEAALADHYGLPEPEADDPSFAALAAVVLGRSVDRRKRARVLAALDEAGLLDPSALAETDAREVVEVVKGSGIALAARAVAPLGRLARWLVEHHDGSAESLRDASVSTDQLREELAGLNGIGPAMADAILLEGARRASYPLDRATYRILVRHGWLDLSADYEEARSLVVRQHPDDAEALARLSGWLERIGRDFCRASVAHCERCPLRPWLPEGGPIEAEGG